MLKWSSMGKCQKYLCNLIQTVTHIRALTVNNICQIITVYFNEKQNYAQKTVVTVEAGTGSKQRSVDTTMLPSDRISNQVGVDADILACI